MSTCRQLDDRDRKGKVTKPPWNNESCLRIQHRYTSETISLMQLYILSKKQRVLERNSQFLLAKGSGVKAPFKWISNSVMDSDGWNKVLDIQNKQLPQNTS